jgi:hypothetical protein
LISAKHERRLLDVPAQPSPTDPDGEHKDHEQRQCWSELDAEQGVGHRSDAEAVVEAHAHFNAGDHGFSSFRRGFVTAMGSPRLLLAANRLRIQVTRLTVKRR